MDLQMLPSPDNRPQNASAALHRLFRCVLRRKATLFALLATAAAAIGLDIYMPILIERCIDAIAGKGFFSVRMQSFYPAFIRLCVVIAASALFGWLHGFLSSRLNQSVAADFRAALFRKVIRAPLSVSEQYASGDLMSRILNDSALAASAFSDVLLSLFSDGLVIVGCAVVMFVRSAALAGITVGASFASLVLTALVSRVLFPAFFAQQTALGVFNAHAEESMRAFRACMLFGRRYENMRLFSLHSRSLYDKSVRAAKLEGIMEPLMMLLGNVNFLLIIVFGAKRVLSGAVTLGMLQAFILYSRQFMEPVMEFGGCFSKVQSSLAAAERIFALLDAPEETDVPALPSAQMQTAEDGYIRFDRVRFAYRKSHTVLHDVSLQIAKGDRLAVVGVTGAGKTTLVSLLMRLYDEYTGDIFLDGTNIRSIPLHTLRERITIIPQEPQIITGTILENLRYGAPDAPREQVERASQAVGLDAIVQALPLGYETMLRSDAPFLSQGQLQLICLARALLRDADVLILDESTSSVDAAMESALAEGMRAVTEGKTCIIIAHRLSSILDAAHICVVRDGGVVQCISNDRRQLRQDGFYRELLANRFVDR